MTVPLTHFKEKLEAELAILEAELKTVGRHNPKNPADWEAKPEPLDVLPADANEVADRIESYEENIAILTDLEIRYNEVKAALTRIEAGTYGTCSVCGGPIEVERLEANPPATTCKRHLNTHDVKRSS